MMIHEEFSMRYGTDSIKSVAILILCLVLIASCKKRSPHYPMIDPKKAGVAAINEYDKNKNGEIEGSELEAVPSLKSSLQRLDINRDGAISADEISSCIEEWQDRHLGGSKLTCIVTHNNQPLQDAEVSFATEVFLWGNERVFAIGQTDSDGIALMNRKSSPDDDALEVVSCGFYRVKIVKTGKNIPAKYNTNTILGIGVLWTDPNYPNVVRFDLEY